MKVVVIAGGQGTRFVSGNREIPKAMIPIGGKPILEYEVEMAKRYGYTDFLFIIGHMGDQIEHYFEDGRRWNVNIEYYKEEKPLGTAGALGCLKNKLTEDFFVFYGDTVMDFDMDAMLAYHKEKQADATIAVLQVPMEEAHRFGIMQTDGEGMITAFWEKPKNPVKMYRQPAQTGTRGARGGYTANPPSSIAGCSPSSPAAGRCVPLLKGLMTTRCVYDCKSCVNRRSNEAKRAMFTPEELADLTIQFYRRNYIEGLFLSSGVLRSPDYTTERMIECLRILREEYRFNGYIHAKAIPGTSPELVQRLGLLADRLSVNIELPSQKGLQTLAPDKSKQAILRPMAQIRDRARESKAELVKSRHAPVFAPAGQSTQLIVGATADNDRHILHLTQSLYEKYRLKRVFYSAYVPVVENSLLPSKDTKPPLLREHRLYQADWLLRFYGFRAEELLDEQHPDFNPLVDPKCHWAIGHLEQFPLEIMNAEYETLLRVPGIGPISARRIVSARRHGTLRFEDLKKLGVVLKRAQFFIPCGGRMRQGLQFTAQTLQRQLEAMERGQLPPEECRQLSLFDSAG